jgi:hypothetical protein
MCANSRVPYKICRAIEKLSLVTFGRREVLTQYLKNEMFDKRCWEISNNFPLEMKLQSPRHFLELLVTLHIFVSQKRYKCNSHSHYEYNNDP